MPGKRLTPDQLTEAVTLREAGYTIAAIAERLGVSVSSLQRAYKRLSVAGGSLKAEVIDQAREQLLAHVTSNEQIKQEAARLVADDLAHVRMLRAQAAATAERLTPSDTAEAALTMRALVAYSTILKNTSDTIRHSLTISGQPMIESVDDLPELPIRLITPEEIEELRKQQEEGMDMTVC